MDSETGTRHQRWAKTWEFQALLKARPAVGDADLGKQYMTALMPLVWTACEREGFVPDFQAMRRRVDDLVPAGVTGRELKLGPGGLRDIEFAVQSLQLVLGYDDPSLHVASTVGALSALSAGGYVSRNDAANLLAAYEFLRLLEHRLQLQRLKRTHMLPAQDDVEALRWLARAVLTSRDERYDALAVLEVELKRHGLQLSRVRHKLFYQPLLNSVEQTVDFAFGMTPAAAERRLAAMDFQEPHTALAHLAALTNQSGWRGRIQTVLLPTLLNVLSETADPDRGLLIYRRISESLAEERWYLSTLRDDRTIAERFMFVLGASPYASELLMRNAEVIRQFTDDKTGCKLLDVESAAVGLTLVDSARREDKPASAINVFAELYRRELARIASADLLGMLEVTDVCAAVTSVTVAMLQATLDVVIRDNIPAAASAPARIAIIGMGRLGGGEIGYGSDLDILFVCDPATGVDEPSAVSWSVAVAAQLHSLLTSTSVEPSLHVKTDLRPGGHRGPLVRTLSSYVTHYSQAAQLWESQALLRARLIAGDSDLGRKFLRVADALRYREGGVSPAEVEEFRQMKVQMEARELPLGADPNTHTTVGRGGLADVEWTLQLLQLRSAHKIAALRTSSTLESLDAVGAAELISMSDVDLLRQAWLTVTRARNALVLVRGESASQLPRPGRQLDAVAVAAGWSDGGEFLDRYLLETRRARSVVKRIWGD